MAEVIRKSVIGLPHIGERHFAEHILIPLVIEVIFLHRKRSVYGGSIAGVGDNFVVVSGESNAIFLLFRAYRLEGDIALIILSFFFIFLSPREYREEGA